MITFSRHSLLLFLLPLFCFSQENLSVRYQEFVKGNLFFAANSIVNKVDSDGNANTPYNNITNTAKLNDELNMRYIDIDNDASTFSSSSSTLDINFPTKKIKFAGLYWSATYMYDEIEKKIKKDRYVFKIVNETRSPFNSVKFKLPNSDEYIQVNGEVLYDAFNGEEFKLSSPYVVFADVTHLLQSLPDANGEYTVANIRATQGFIEGGVSGGWSLFVVAESESASQKQITIYDGCIPIFKDPTLFEVKGFETPSEGTISASLTFAALEGDANIKGDEVALKTNLDKRFYKIINSHKENGNFFSSAITKNDGEFDKRVPNSKNNLGFDALTFEYKNDFNKTISNNATSLEVKMYSKYDRYFLFFFGMELEANKKIEDAIAEVEPEASSQNKKTKSSENEELAQNDTTNSKNKTSETIIAAEKATSFEKKSTEQKEKNTTISAINSVNPNTLDSNKATNTVVSSTIVPTNETSSKNEILKTSLTEKNITNSPIIANFLKEHHIENQKISNINRGYYLVVNVYSNKKYADSFYDTLNKNGLNPKMFYNEDNHYYYVYLNYSEDLEEIILLYNSNFNYKYNDEMWIKAVNLEE